jgi:uncharacterized protein DUF6789
MPECFFCHLPKGIIAGFVATVVMSVMMMIKKATGVLPELDPIHMLSMTASQKMGLPEIVLIGWGMHFIIGAVIWGGLFAIFNHLLPGHKQIIKGMVLGTIAWLLMMVGAMPANGAGLFGLNISVLVPIMALMLHLVYGAVLGGTYQRLTNN